MRISEKIVNRLLEGNTVIYGKPVPTVEQVIACFENPSVKLAEILDYARMEKKPYCICDEGTRTIRIYFLYLYPSGRRLSGDNVYVQKGMQVDLGSEGELIVENRNPGDFYNYKDKTKIEEFSEIHVRLAQAALEAQLGSYPPPPGPVTKEDVMAAAADPNSELSRILGNHKPEPYMGNDLLIRTGSKSGFIIDFREPNELHWPRGFVTQHSDLNPGYQYTYTKQAKELAKEVEACLNKLGIKPNPRPYDPFDL